MSKFKTNGEYFAYSKTLSVIPTEDIVQLFKKHGISIPYYVHKFILRETIYPKVFQSKLYDTYSDELKYRLRGYNDYSIYLLENLISNYNLEFDAAKYKENLFNFIFLNREVFNLKNGFIDDLDRLKFKYTVDFESITYTDFMSIFQSVLYEETGYLDGVSLKILKDVLVHSCTLGDLRGIGEKYGVKIPRRINKSKLVEILSARFMLTEEENAILQGKSVLEIEIYAKEKGFNISIDLKKSDMVEYLIHDLKMYHMNVKKDSYSYDIPLLADLDSVKIDSISFESNDQDIPVVELEEEKKTEPEVVEQKQEIMKEEAKEEVKEEVPVVTVDVSTIEDEAHETQEPATVVEEQIAPQEEVEIEKETPKKEVITPVVKPIVAETEEITKEEKELLDEKIDQIIKRYKKKKRVKTFWTVLLLSLLLLVLLFVGYSYLYYTVIDPGKLPFDIPVFWNSIFRLR